MTNYKNNIIRVSYISSDTETLDLIRAHFDSLGAPTIAIDHSFDPKSGFQKIKSFHPDLLILEIGASETAEAWTRELEQAKVHIPAILMVPSSEENISTMMKIPTIREVVIKSDLLFQNLAGKILDWCSSVHGKETPRISALFSEIEPKEESDVASDYRKTSNRDPVTGIYNHSHLFERMAEEFERAKRHSYPISCLVLDIDHFRPINEKWSYRVGDQILRECVQLIMQNCRLSDLIARHGGEEFAILMPHTDGEGAQQVADRLRLIFSEHRFRVDASELHITVSMGISTFPEDPITKHTDLFTMAMQSLLKSKALGRNRTTRFKNIAPVFGKDDLPTLRISEEKILEFQRKISDIASNSRKFYIEAAKAMIQALESKDSFTAGHAGSVARYSSQITEAMGLPLDEAEMIEHAALLHDIGKICIPDQILLKPSKLTFAEFETMRQHPYLGYKMLKPLKFLDRESKLVLHHHEWYNGEGYPCRLKGEEIPLGSRVIAVADAYDTMRTAGGRYKKTCSAVAAVSELIGCAGVQFDPRVVKAFIDVLILRGEISAADYDKTRLDKALIQFPQLAPDQRKPFAA